MWSQGDIIKVAQQGPLVLLVSLTTLTLFGVTPSGETV